MKWIKLISEDQLPFDTYFLVINNDPNSIHAIPDMMIDDGSFRCYEGDEDILRCYSGSECSVNYYNANIESNYTHFMIIEAPNAVD